MRPVTSPGKVLLALLAALALTAAIAVGLAADRDPKRRAADPGVMAAREVTSGPVQIKATPLGVDANGASFKLELDNHEIDLTMDLARGASLTVGATAWTPARWSGDGPSGHHREGTLRFLAAGPATGQVVLTLTGFPEPVRLSWTLQAGRASS